MCTKSSDKSSNQKKVEGKTKTQIADEKQVRFCTTLHHGIAMTTGTCLQYELLSL